MHSASHNPVLSDIWLNSCESVIVRDTMGEKERENPRITMDILVNYDLEAVAHTKDISTGGICLVTEDSFANGRMLNLVFLFTEHPEEITCFGKVVWSRHATAHLWESGVSFWEMSDEDRSKLRECLVSESQTL